MLCPWHAPPFRALIAAFACTLASADPGAGQLPTATATWDASGIMVVFPRDFSPDRISRDTIVGDAFSGYEWRVILVGDREVLVAALVVPPDRALLLPRVETVADAYRLGDLRRCVRDDITLACGRPARGWVRDAEGRVEIGIADFRWLQLAARSPHPRLRLVVRRARQELWSEDVPLVYADH
ncbi:MAG: hypothetical protein ABJC19_00945 [Gemmatimonadota bacterium]